MRRKLFINGLIAAAALGLGIVLSLGPWQVARLQRNAADKMLSDMKRAEAERAELSRKKAQYESTLGKEELARNQGYRQPDETPAPVGQ